MKCHLRANNTHAQIRVSSGTTEKICVLKHISLKTVIKYKLNKTAIHAQEVNVGAQTEIASHGCKCMITFISNTI